MEEGKSGMLNGFTTASESVENALNTISIHHKFEHDN